MKDALPLMWRNIPERYNLIGSHCETCGGSFYPQRRICPNCRRRGKLRQEKMPEQGTIISFSRVHVAPKGFEHESPYWLAIVELKNKVRLLSQIVDSSEGEVKIGASVEMVFRRIYEDSHEGVIAYGYKFRVV